MKFQKSTEYVWMLKNKTTGSIYTNFTYHTRESARKAVRSTSGRFSNFTPVKVTAAELKRFSKSSTTGKTVTSSSKKSTTTRSISSSKTNRTWFPISSSRYIG